MTRPKSFKLKTQRQTGAQFLTPDETPLPITDQLPIRDLWGLNPIHIFPFQMYIL